MNNDLQLQDNNTSPSNHNLLQGGLNAIIDDGQDCISDSEKIEEACANRLHKSRYLAKVVLQTCALMSQTGKHQDALIAAKRASAICFDLIKSSQLLSKRYVQ